MGFWIMPKGRLFDNYFKLPRVILSSMNAEMSASMKSIYVAVSMWEISKEYTNFKRYENIDID